MPKTAALVNFAGGETSPRSRGRFDREWFRSSCRKLLNFIPEVPGAARFRAGLQFRRQTRGGAVARMIPFQLNRDTAYMLEFTALKMRAYDSDGELLVTTQTTLTAATKANPCVITVADATNLANGDEIIVKGVVGMEALNGRQFLLAGKSGSTFQLKDPATGANINSTSFGTYASGGTVYEVREITTPYLAADLDNLQWAGPSALGTMYLTCLGYSERKLTVDSDGNFTIATVTRTNDPFSASAAVLTIVGITRSGQTDCGVTTVAGRTFIVMPAGSVFYEGVRYAFASFATTTQINGNTYKLLPYTPWFPTSYVWAELVNPDTGAGIDSNAWTAHPCATDDGGRATPAAENPLTVGFYEGRRGFFGTDQRANTLFLSRSPNPSTGAARLDDFTGGTDPSHACFYATAPASGRVDYAAWLRSTPDYLMVGTFGGPFRFSGGGLAEPITPTSVDCKQISSVGCEATMPASDADGTLYFIERGGVGVHAISTDEVGRAVVRDMLLNAEHLADSPLRRVALQGGDPNILWVVRDDGVLLGATVLGAENVTGWHRHKIAGTDAKVLDVQTLSRSDRVDQLWAVTERTVNGTTRRFVEILADDVVFPDPEDFYTDASTQDDDTETYLNVCYRRQEEYKHMDACATYNGADRGVDAEADIALSGQDPDTEGATITVTATAAVFRSGDVGLEIWWKPDRDTGVGQGRAVITSYTSTTEVEAEVLVPFTESGGLADDILAGEWYFAATEIYGLAHLDGETVAVVTDGAVYSDGRGDADAYPVMTVAHSRIVLAAPAAVVHVGLPYDGFIQPHDLSLRAEPVGLATLFIRFLNSLGVSYGTDLYALNQVHFRKASDINDRPTPPFSGLKELFCPDDSTGAAETRAKHVFVSQQLPLPCVVLGLELQFDAPEEG